MVRFLHSRDGCEDKILRFGAKLVTDNERDKGREFVINFYVYDSTISVYELPKINSGEYLTICELPAHKKIVEKSFTFYLFFFFCTVGLSPEDFLSLPDAGLLHHTPST